MGRAGERGDLPSKCRSHFAPKPAPQQRHDDANVRLGDLERQCDAGRAA
jgi:hypothetical protein